MLGSAMIPTVVCANSVPLAEFPKKAYLSFSTGSLFLGSGYGGPILILGLLADLVLYTALSFVVLYLARKIRRASSQPEA
jgi:hypothetical protein